MSSHRIKRIEETYLREFATLLVKQIQDPRLQGVRITRVSFTPDLRLARVYFFVENKTFQKEVLKGFQKSKGFLKREMAQKVSLRFAPELQFFFDDRLEGQEQIEKLFQEIRANPPNPPFSKGGKGGI